MATSQEYPDLPFVQPRSWTGGRGGYGVQYIVVHHTAGSERPNSAEEGALYDQRRTDGTSTHYFCVDPETKILTADMRWRPARDVHVADELVGFDEYAVAGSKRRMHVARVTRAESRQAERVAITLADGRVLRSSNDHRWLTFSGNNYKWRVASRFRPGQRLCVPLRPWGEPPHPADAGWLAGIFDGEGCYGRSSGVLSFAQKDGAVLDRARAILDDMGFHYHAHKRPSDVTIVAVSGLQSLMQFLGQCRPVRFVDRTELWAGKALSGTRLYPGQMEIVSVEQLGKGEVVSLSTTTRTFIADGVAAHNCDQNSTVQCVYTWDTAHSAFYWGNHLGIQYELCGGQQTRDQWLDPASDATLWIAAKQMARDCAKYGLPVRKLTPAQMVNGERGLCGHGDVTLAYGQGDHTDPGPYFPWDVLLTRINRFLSPVQPEEDDDMKPALFHKTVGGIVTYGLQTDARFVQAREYSIAQRWAELYGDSREVSPSAFDSLAAEYGSDPEAGVP